MKYILLLFVMITLTACSNEKSTKIEELSDITENIDDKQKQEENKTSESQKINEEHIDYEKLKAKIIDQFENVSPTDWGENVGGVITNIDTEEKVVALTFDACDGSPDSYDKELIDFLTEEEIPATLFLNAQWVKANEEQFMELAQNDLFEIANHGDEHKPLSVTGASAYGIQGTKNVEDVIDEVLKNQELIYELTGEYPQYFRSGTAYYDDIAVKIANELGLRVVNYNVLGDAGATFNHSQIVSTLKTAEPGSIYLFHMNKPNSDVSSGVTEGVQLLKEKNFDFVRLGEYHDSLVE